MDANDANKKPKTRTEDNFPGSSGAWENAWCLDPLTFRSQGKEERSRDEKTGDPDRFSESGSVKA